MSIKVLKPGMTRWYSIRMYRLFTWLGTLFIVLGSAFLIIYNSPDRVYGTSFFTAGFVLYMISISQFLALDERYRKTVYKSAFAGWWCCLIFVMMAMGLMPVFNMFLPFEVGGYQFLGGALIVMVVTMAVFTEYYLHKGDVE